MNDHPIACVFPLLEGDAFDGLVADIRQNGLLHPIVLFDGMVLDGRNRQRACTEAGVVARTVTFTGDDPVGYVLSSNLQRRHLSEGQRAMVAAKVANLPVGRPSLQDNSAPVRSSARAARSVGVSTRSVESARAVLKAAEPEVVAAVESGALPLKVAAAATKLSAADQRKVAAEPKKAGTAVKQYQRKDRESALAKATATASKKVGSNLYGVIYADPPWHFAPYSTDTGMDRSAENHYPTMTTDDICGITVPVAADAALFLWATVPMLPEALRVMGSWGFDYRSHFVWAKNRAGTGYWTRNKHELLLIGTRGKIPAPAPGKQYESVIGAQVGKHSAKPQAFAEMIESMFPSARLLEMFARGPRLGWDVWGNEAPKEQAA